jgi:hypothetical protein
MDSLAREVGPRTASALALEGGMARRAAAGLGELAALLAATASRLGVPLVLLKFAALRAGGFVADGWRVAGDVDALVPPGGAERLATALSPHGFEPAGFRDGPHHLPLLRDAQGRGLDLHVHVPDLHLESGGTEVTCAALIESGHVRRAGLPGDCFVPSPPVMVAHAMVHALVHHGCAPHAYPLLRVVGDLVDLGVARDDGSLARAALPFVEHELTEAEVAATVALCRRLGGGDPALLESGESASPEGILLRHFVAGVLDDDYGRALHLADLRARFGRARGRGQLVTALARYVWRAVFITDAQIDVIYGRPRTRLGYLYRRLLRPLDLAGRAARAVAGSVRVRLRR